MIACPFDILCIILTRSNVEKSGVCTDFLYINAAESAKHCYKHTTGHIFAGTESGFGSAVKQAIVVCKINGAVFDIPIFCFQILKNGNYFDSGGSNRLGFGCRTECAGKGLHPCLCLGRLFGYLTFIPGMNVGNRNFNTGLNRCTADDTGFMCRAHGTASGCRVNNDIGRCHMFAGGRKRNTACKGIAALTADRMTNTVITASGLYIYLNTPEGMVARQYLNFSCSQDRRAITAPLLLQAGFRIGGGGDLFPLARCMFTGGREDNIRLDIHATQRTDLFAHTVSAAGGGNDSDKCFKSGMGDAVYRYGKGCSFIFIGNGDFFATLTGCIKGRKTKSFGNGFGTAITISYSNFKTGGVQTFTDVVHRFGGQLAYGNTVNRAKFISKRSDFLRFVGVLIYIHINGIVFKGKTADAVIVGKLGSIEFFCFGSVGIVTVQRAVMDIIEFLSIGDQAAEIADPETTFCRPGVIGACYCGDIIPFATVEFGAAGQDIIKITVYQTDLCFGILPII